jgi:4-alpha-glucanotransferase
MPSLPTPSKPLFNWLTSRSAGVLLHPTSLPGDQGIGTFEPEPLGHFLDFLSASGMRQWQVCPLGPTGYGDSPYQCFSAFAGNPYLIDLKALVQLGLLPAGELEVLRRLDEDRVNFGRLWELKWPMLAKAFERFQHLGRPLLPYGSFESFKSENASWLAPYAIFRALKDHYLGAPWWEWPMETRRYAKAAHSPLIKRVAEETEAHAFYQYLFFGQWAEARKMAAARGIEIIGDLPIFVALDSADAWSAPHLFEISEATGHPLAVAGVPPDYFSADGQLWGNPLYRWDVHEADGFAWWRSRLEASFKQADIVRIDHFRGFDEYWRIPAGAETAKTGEWMPGPGLAFFKALRDAFPAAKIIAEDLGEIGPSVGRLRDQAGLPGMAILQFAFGGDAGNLYLPHNHSANTIVYPGTHDNDTSLGWYASSGEKVRDHVRRYLRITGAEIGWDLIRASYASVGRMALFPMQDLLSLGTQARLNTPGAAQGNWQWRYTSRELEALEGGSARYLRSLSVLFGRTPDAASPAKRSS